MSQRRPAIAARLATSLLAAVALVAVATPIGAQSASAETSPGGVEVERYGGADRYTTSLEVAQAVLDDAGGTADWAVMVSGTSWPDAVVSASLAGALDAPVLLTPRDELLTDTAEFLAAASVGNVIVVGSAAPPGISNSVVSELESEGYAVERISGSSRSETSVAVARHLGTVRQSDSGSVSAVGSMPGFGTTAIVTSSEVFADALVSGPVSAYGGHPVLLTSPHGLDTHVADYLTEAGVEHVVLMGGTAALSAPVHQALVERGLAVTRLAGATRFETAVLMAELVHERYADSGGHACFSYTEVGLARARVPFDSFSAAPLLANRCASLLLTDPTKTNTATSARLRIAAASGADALQLHVFGGSAAVSVSVLDAYFSEEPTPAQPVATRSGCGSDGSARVQLAVVDLIENVTWNSDCSRMAWTNTERELWVANGDGSTQQRLLGDFGKLKWPVWSPDGDRIAFSTLVGIGSDATQHIYVINADGSGRTQVTDGDSGNGTPAWSPDGRRLAFTRTAEIPSTTPGTRQYDRYLVVADADGSNETSLLQGGAYDEAPSWSPDGRRIAYGSNGSIWIMNADGTDSRAVTSADTRRGASWSPDGNRIAAYDNKLGRADDEGSNGIVIVEVGGIGQKVLPLDDEILNERFYPHRAPQWSPDSRRVFFHASEEPPYRYQRPAANQMLILEAPVPQEPATRTCKPKSRGGLHTAGFPLPDWARSSFGVLRAAVLFVDFPDAIPTHSTREESDSSLRYVQRYIDAMSYGQFDVEFVPHHTWLRAEHPHTHYLNDSKYGELLWQPIGEHAVELADRDGFDFSDFDVVMTVMPSTLFGGGGNEGFDLTADGNVMRTIRINHGYHQGGYSTRSGSDERYPLFNPWGRTAAHELMHSLGLADLRWDHLVGLRLWPIGHPLAPAPLPEGESWAPIIFGAMELNGRERVTGGPSRDRRLEMLAWSRWQLGWIGADQVECISEPFAEVRLSPIADPGTGTAMAAVQVSRDGVIVIENRRLLGYDLPARHTYDRIAEGLQDPQYLNEGILVYTVNSHLGEHPASLIHDDGRGYLSRFPLLDVGDEVSVAGYTISVVADAGADYLVSIRKSD